MRNHEGHGRQTHASDHGGLMPIISEASHDLSEEMIRKAVVCMRTRAAKLVAMNGREKDLIKFGNLNIIHLVPEAQW